MSCSARPHSFQPANFRDQISKEVIISGFLQSGYFLENDQWISNRIHNSVGKQIGLMSLIILMRIQLEIIKG